MGHLLTAAGMSGLLKVLLSMQKNCIPPNINLQDPVQADNGWMGQAQMILAAQPWESPQKQAGINSFGFGGTNAHMVVQNHRPQNRTAPHTDATALQTMAIVGMDAHFGNCTQLDDFYQSIFYGRQHFRDLPAERWKGFDTNKALLDNYGLKDIPSGAYIDHFEIDLLRYKIQPKEAETLEPQQALILKVADNALKDAGISESQNVAVLIAMESELAIHHYLARWDVSWQLKRALEQSNITLNDEQYQALETACKNAIYQREGSQTPSQHTSFVGNIMASRIAALWDFSGPAFTISCGEDAAFKALEVAQNLLSLGEVDAVVVGGVDFSGGLENVLLRNQQGPLNASAQPSLSWNKNDRGWLIGEGAGAVVLKRKDQLQADEKVYAFVEEICPTIRTQGIGYLELAATGFAEQEQEEWHQLQTQAPNQKVALGSVKANIGHTFAASGIAALIKTALCLHHRFLPGIPNWEGPHAARQLQHPNYYFPNQARPWIRTAKEQQRRAAINGCYGGQIQLAEAPLSSTPTPAHFLIQNTARLFALKGSDATNLHQKLSALEIALETDASLEVLAQQFYQTFQEKTGNYCMVLVAKSKAALLLELAYFKKQIDEALTKQVTLKTPQGSYFTAQPLGPEAPIAFVYPGSATAYEGLGQSVFQLFPDLYQHYEKLVPSLERFVFPEYLYPQTVHSAAAKPNIYQDAIAMMSTG
ncbi:MAG: beta-ketoacyl synthase N-terminal-like domain-containing protein, partial [Bacteroidota bacterium]